MATILDEILVTKRAEVLAASGRLGASEMAERARTTSAPTRGLRRALETSAFPAIIAEIKRRSPSKGQIRADFDPVECARAYAGAGAAAISVLTDEAYFGGSLADLRAVREAVSLPLLRKDFVIDAYQIDEARVHGADAVLLIVAALGSEQLAELCAHAAELGLDALVEVHDAKEAEVALEAGAELIGVNNRDLRTFEVDLGTTERLAPRIAEGGSTLVAESGIHTREDVERLRVSGAQAFLVGEALMRADDVGRALERLRGPV